MHMHDDIQSQPTNQTNDQTEEKENTASCCDTLRAQCDEYKAGWQRAQADYHNLKKETEEKRGELMDWCKLRILEDVIPIYDNFKKAIQFKPTSEAKEWNNWAQGVEFVAKQLNDLLTQHSIVAIDTIGKQFDPTCHDAVGEEQHADMEEGTIIKEIESGYMIGSRVIKPAKVIINTRQ